MSDDPAKENQSGEKTASNDYLGEKDGWIPPFMAPPLSRPLVGRDDLARQVKTRLFQDGNCPVIVLTQLPGVGKTALAIHLANDEEVIQHFPDGILWAPLGQAPDARALLGEWMLALGFNTQDVSNAKGVEERKNAIIQKIGDRRMLLVLDVAWEVESAREFLLGGKNCAHVLTTRFTNPASELPGAEIINVPELSDEEGLALLEQLAPRAVRAERKQAADLVRAVGGLPLALVLMGKHLWQESLSGQPRRIKAALERLKDAEMRLSLNQAGSLLSCVSPSLLLSIQVSEEVLEEETRKVLTALSILQPKPWSFTRAVAKEIAGAEKRDLEALMNAGLLEQLPGERFMISRSVADYARSKLGAAERERLHIKAAEYFLTSMRQYEEARFGDATPYQRRYAYEHPDWQAFKAPGTYHLAELHDRTGANLIYAEVYFDTFWWWRCYNENFPFNDLLLDLWRESVRSPEDQNWLGQVEKFHRSYPTGYIDRGNGDWGAVEASLLAIRELGQMEGNVFELDPRQRHVRAITNMFLAESYRFRSLEDRRADRYYQESLAIFARGEGEREREDSWNLPWALWHLSDLSLERGQYNEARNQAQKAREIVHGSSPNKCERDNEIVANTFRVDADSYWQEGNYDCALQNYTRGLFYAYIFNACPMQLPDFYTADFYREMVSRIVQRIISLVDQGEEGTALTWIAHMNDFWKPYWELAGFPPPAHSLVDLLRKEMRTELAVYIAPPGPTFQDMTNPKTGYAGKVHQVLAVLGDQMDEHNDTHSP